jgi:ribosomal protein S18 acetylase RimI-like enzyme
MESGLSDDAVVDSFRRLGDELPEPLSRRPNLDLKTYVKRIRDSAEIDFLLTEQDMVIGLCVYYINNHEKKMGFLSLLAIDRGYWGKTYGQILLDRMLLKARERGMQYFTLEVSECNVRARKFYQKNGFSDIAVSNGKCQMQMRL